MKQHPISTDVKRPQLEPRGSDKAASIDRTITELIALRNESPLKTLTTEEYDAVLHAHGVDLSRSQIRRLMQCAGAGRVRAGERFDPAAPEIRIMLERGDSWAEVHKHLEVTVGADWSMKTTMRAVKAVYPKAMRVQWGRNKGFVHARSNFAYVGIDVAAVNDVWHLDSTGGKCKYFKPNGNSRGGKLTLVRAHNIIDANSRYIVGMLAPADKAEAVEICSLIIAACVELGVPRMIIADKGQENDNNSVSDLCNTLRIGLHILDRASPEPNGKVERNARTVVDKFARQQTTWTLDGESSRREPVLGHSVKDAERDAPRLPQLQRQYGEHTSTYNATLRSDGTTPRVVVDEARSASRQITDPKLARALKILPASQVHRVHKDGVHFENEKYVNIDPHSFSAGPHRNGLDDFEELIGRTVRVRAIPGDKTRVALYLPTGDRFICFATRHRDVKLTLTHKAAVRRSKIIANVEQSKALLHLSNEKRQAKLNISAGYIDAPKPKSNEAFIQHLATLLGLDPGTLVYGETGNIAGAKLGEMLDAIHLETLDLRPETTTFSMYAAGFAWWATQTNRTLLRFKRPGQIVQYDRRTTTITILDDSRANPTEPNI